MEVMTPRNDCMLFVKMIFPSRELGKLTQGDNSQSLSYKYWFDVCDYGLHKSRSCDLVTRRQYLF